MASYRVGVIGCGGIGVEHASGLLDLKNATLSAACDLEESTLIEFRDRWQSEWPGLNTYSNHRDMLAKEDLDIITVATSDHMHADLVVDAANAGVKGIFCEKPLATNLADADRMVCAAERNGAILSVDHTRRFQPLWRHVKEKIVDGGEIGSVQQIVAAAERSTFHVVQKRYASGGFDLLLCGLGAGLGVCGAGSRLRGLRGVTGGDGGHDPATEPSASGYIHFANGVRGFFRGRFKSLRRSQVQV